MILENDAARPIIGPEVTARSRTLRSRREGLARIVSVAMGVTAPGRRGPPRRLAVNRDAPGSVSHGTSGVRWGLDAAFPAGFVALVVPHLHRLDGRVAAALGATIALVLVPVAPAGVPVLAASLAVQTAELIKAAPQLELIREPDLGVVLFRRLGWKPEDYDAWAQRLHQDQVAFIPPTKWEGETVGRFAFLHPATTIDLVREVLGRTE